jgi:hypothetical protein
MIEKETETVLRCNVSNKDGADKSAPYISFKNYNYTKYNKPISYTGIASVASLPRNDREKTTQMKEQRAFSQ